MMRSRIENKSFSKEESHAILQTFVELILTGSLNDQLVQNLNLGLTSLLNSGYITEDSENTVNICQFLVTHIISIAGNKDLVPISFKPIILLLQTIVSSSCTNESNGIQVIAKQLEGVSTIIQISMETLNKINLELNQNLFLSCTEVLRVILDLFFLILLKMKKLSLLGNIIPTFINSFLSVIIACISIEAKIYENGDLFSSGNLISFSDRIEVDSNLNSMKAKAFQVLSYIIQTESGGVIKNEIIIQPLSKLVNLTVSSLYYIVNEKMKYISEMSKSSKEFPDNNYENVIFQMMLFLCRFLTREPIISQFTGYVKK